VLALLVLGVMVPMSVAFTMVIFELAIMPLLVLKVFVLTMLTLAVTVPTSVVLLDEVN